MQCIKTLLLSALLLAMFAGVGQADVFGLKKGMTLEQVRALEFGKLEKQENSGGEDMWGVKNPKTPKGAYSALFVFVPDKGLLKVGIHWEIETNSHGDGIKEKFKELKTILSEKYGKGETFDFLKPGSIWNRPQDWMIALQAQERYLDWALADGIAESEKNKLTAIALRATADSGSMGGVSLAYEFQGWNEHLNTREKKEASEF